MDNVTTTCGHCGAIFTDRLWWEYTVPTAGTGTPRRRGAPFQFRPGQCPRCKHIAPVDDTTIAQKETL